MDSLGSGVAAAARPTYDDIRDEVMAWVREIMEDPAVQLGDNFLDVGGHSMLAVELNQRAIDAYAAEFSVEVLYKETFADAIRDLAATIAAAEPVSAR